MSARPDRPGRDGTATVVARVLLGGGGTAMIGFGAVSLWQVGPQNLLATLPWLVGGVVLHDAVLVPLVLLLAVTGASLLPPWLRAPVGGGLLVLGAVTLLAIPVLGRFGAKADNPTLLDRSYLAGWLVLATLVAVGTGLSARVRLRRQQG